MRIVWIKWYAHGIRPIIREVRMPLMLLLVVEMMMVVMVVVLFVTRLVIIIIVIVVYVRIATVGSQLYRQTLSQVSNHF